MIKKEQIQNIVSNAISGTEIFLVHVSVGKDNRIFVRIDKPGNITLEECQSLSKTIESQFDREVEDFELEVSSPGLGEPFKVIQQFKKSIGRKISVNTSEGNKFTGLLIDLIEEEITIEVEEKVKIKKNSDLNPGLSKTGKKNLVRNFYKFNINNITAKEVLSI